MEVTVSMESLNANAEEMQRIKDERDALAAHVERLNSVVFDALTAMEDGNLEDAPFDLARDVYNETPTTSLARLKEAWKFDVLNELADKKKAEWQAEVIDRLLHEDMNSGAGGDILPARMWKLANKLRQASEES